MQQDYNALVANINSLLSAFGTKWITPPTPIPPTPTTGQFGFTANAFQSLNASSQAAWLADMKNLGMSWLRFDANWWVIEQTKGIFNWTALDQAVKSCVAAEFNVCLIIDGCPPWAGNGNQWSIPNNALDYATFCTLVAQRYAPQGVHTYEVWNEPNNTAFWPGPNVGAYVNLLKAAYPAIKAGDSTSTVLVGGLSPTGSVSTWGASFVKNMYANGAKGYFDAMNTHPYTYPANPGDNTSDTWSQQYLSSNQAGTSILAQMQANGDGNKKIWMTEFGAPTSTASNGVTRAQQASQLAEAITKNKTYSWAGPLFLYTYMDSGTDPSNNEDNFGVVTTTGAQKPSYASVKTAIGG